jgi:diadenosine tetraphosphatase ApaH/serine/threonine PP2A family protein phosphatase
MKIGIFGDVHGNLAALEAVLSALHDAGCHSLVCTGDMVGYGPAPAECVRRVRESGAACVLGNHDEYATDVLGNQLERLDADTRATIEWARNRMPMDDLKWLASLPLKREVEGFTVVHGALGPQHWAYIVNRENLLTHFAHQKTLLCFNGHTHLPLYCAQAAPAQPPEMDFLKTTVLPAGGRVLVNPGSVGQPRDRDPRAACCVYDVVAGAVHPLRVPYDIAATQALMRSSGLPERFTTRIAVGR